MASNVGKEQLKFKCSIDLCAKEYNTKHGLKHRVQTIHLGVRFECGFCSSKFTNKFCRNNYIMSAHKAFQCEKCPAKFSKSQLMSEHRLVHSEERRHKCHICPKQYKRNSGLRRHQRIHTQNRTRDFGCSICKKTFFTKSDLQLHGKRHGEDGAKFGCYFCNKRFIAWTGLGAHIRVHTQEKPFVCTAESCQFSSSHSGSLRRHTNKRHSSADQEIKYKIWSCYFCSKTLASIKSFTNHLRSHTLEQPFSCGLCQKRFSTQPKLKHHISTHTMEKPFRCEECQKCFTAHNDLLVHVATVHRKERSFFCKFCNFSSYRRGDFNKHTLRHNSTNICQRE